MKKLMCKLCLLIAFGMMLFVSDAISFMIPPTPFSIEFDGAADASGGVEAVGNVVANTAEKVQQTTTKLRDKVKNWLDNIVSKLGLGGLHKKKKGDTAIATSREIKESEVANIHDEESVIKAFYVLFGEYPKEYLKKYKKDVRGVKKAYKDKGIEFSNDSLVELYITSRQLDKMIEVLDKDIAGMTPKYVLGTAAEPSPEISGEGGEANDELNSWVNYYKVNDIYDSVLRLTEELSALDAQYEAGRALKKGIEPIDPTAKNEKVSSNEIGISLKSKTSFAQLSLPSWIKKVDLTETIKSAGGVSEVKPEVAQSPFKGAGNQFADLVKVNKITTVLKEATDIHNFIQQFEHLKTPFVEYNRMKDLHEEVIYRVKNSEQCVIAHLGRYYEDPTSAWLGQGCQYTDGLDIFCDTGLPVTKESLKTLSEGDALCKNNATKICSTYAINRYERRGGLSGWLLSAYKIAKAEKTLEFSADDYASKINDGDVSSTQQIASLEEMEEIEQNAIAEDEQGLNDSPLIRPTDELKMQKNTREREILAWQLGSLASKKISNEMALGDGSAYGTLKNKYPMWNDEKYFYEQYLDLKYENMKIFINSIDLRKSVLALARKINDELYVTETQAEKEAEGYQGPKMRGVLFSEVLQYNNDGFDALDVEIEQVSSPKVDAAKKTQSILMVNKEKERTKLLNAVNAAEQEIKNIYARLDELNVKLNDTKIAYNNAQEEQNQANSQIKAESMVVDLAAKRAKKSANVTTDHIEATSEKVIEASEKTIAKAEKKKEEEQAKVGSLRDQIDDLKDQLNVKNIELTILKAKYAEKMAEIEYEDEVKLTRAYDELKDVRAIKLTSMLKYVGTMKDNIFRDLIDVSSKAEDIVRNNALDAVNEAYAKIKDLKDGRFNPDKHAQIAKIHREMMKKIKNPSISLKGKLNYLSGYVSSTVVDELATKVMTSALFNEVCKESVCYNEDDEYYVSIEPNGKDFSIPKAIAQMYIPPLREVVHFDGFDYDNLIIGRNNEMAKEDVLHIGAMLSTGCEGASGDYFCNGNQSANTVVYTEFVPQIWKTLLSPNGFVERDVPLIPLTKHDGNGDYARIKYNDELMRGGIYPCSLGDYALSVSGGGYIGARNKNYPKCRHVKSYKTYRVLVRAATKPGEKNKYGIRMDVAFEEDEGISVMIEDGSIPEQSLSELALFTRTKTGLKFDDGIKKAIKFLDGLDDDYDKRQKRLYDNMMLDKSQFGDYLKFVEGELEYQKSLDQLVVKIDSARDQINTELAKYNYTPPEDFDLSDAKTYDEIISNMNMLKDERVKKANDMLRGLVGKNDMLKEKIAKNNNTLAMLKLDNNELVSISDMLSIDEVEKRIKTAQADSDTTGEYDKEVEKSYNNRASVFMTPYCAVY